MGEKMTLLPCPWCGEELQNPTVSEGSTFRWRKVDGCCADGPEVRHDTMADDQEAAEVESRAAAIEAWNTRAHLTQPAQAVDAWMTDDGRVISARQKDVALRDGGASASSVAPYYIPLTAALPKDSNGAEVADGWRPIATAPKDGKEVLVAFTADGVRQVAEASWSDDEDAWVCSRDGFMLYRRNEPTHWMPLPDAPQEDTPDAAR